MTLQTKLIFPPIKKPVDYPIVSAQNNKESTLHYEKNKVKFSGQRKTVFEYLMIDGNYLTVKKAMNELNIASLPKRIEELKKQFGVKISDRWDNGFKIWYMAKWDRELNKGIGE